MLAMDLAVGNRGLKALRLISVVLDVVDDDFGVGLDVGSRGLDIEAGSGLSVVQASQQRNVEGLFRVQIGHVQVSL